MNLQKAQLKAAIVENIGVIVEDDLEAAKTKVVKFQGATEALGKAKVVLTDITNKARDDVMNEVVKFDPASPMEVAKFVIARIQEGVAKLHEMSEAYRMMGLQAEGEVAGFRRLTEKIKGIRDEERNKVEAFVKAVESGQVMIEEGSPRFTGEGPTPPGTTGLPVKMIRQQMEEAEADPKALTPPEPSEGEVTPPRKPASKKRKKEPAKDARNS